MKLSDIVTEPWAIEQSELSEMRQIYTTHMKGDKIEFGKNMEAGMKEFLLTGNQNYSSNDNVAIVEIRGTISKQSSIIDSLLFDTISSNNLKMQFLNAIDDEHVDAILLMIDSPGGTVDGTQEFANLIYDNRGKKPVIAYSDGVMASAAYWIGAAADSIYISGGTVRVGSIGVIATHTDWSKMDKEMGLEVTEIIAGKYKNVGTPNKPLSEEHEAIIQNRLDYIYSIFVNDVAKFRGVSVEQALEMADGKIFLGKQSIDAGLVDGEFSETAMIDYIKDNVLELTFSSREPGIQTNEGEIKNMDKSQILEKYPSVHAEIMEDGKAQAKKNIDTDIKGAKSESAKDERDRIQSIYNLCTDSKGNVLAGYADILAESIKDENATEGSVAIKIANQNKAIMESRADALDKDSVPELPDGALVDPEKKVDKKEGFMSKVEKYMNEKDCSRAKAIKTIAREFPDLHKAYLNELNGGTE